MASEKTVERIVPQGMLVGIQFDLMTGGDIEKYSDVTIVETSDVTNSKLGLPNLSSECTTCGSRNVRDCDGHFGVVKLPATIYNPYLVSEVVHILNQICPGCKGIKQDLKKKVSFNSKIGERSIGKDVYPLEALSKKLNGAGKRWMLKLMKSKLQLPARCDLAHAMKFHDSFMNKCEAKKKEEESREICKHCSRSASEWYPSLKFKVSSENIQGKKCMSIVAEVNENFPQKFQNKGLSDELPNDYWNFISGYTRPEGSNMKRISLSPSQAFDILKQLDRGFIEQFVPRRELLFLTCLPVTPNSHRVMEISRPFADGPHLSYDERTKACKRVVDIGRKIGEFQQHEQFGVLAPSYSANRVLDYLNACKLRSYRSSVDDPPCKSGMKWLKDIILSKRSDNAFRLVMVGDPRIRLGEIGIPCDIAENLLIAEKVNRHNFKKLNLSLKVHLLTKEELHTRSKGKLISIHKSNQLQVGDEFYRPLEDGDMVLVNRPPSVHQHSLIGLSVKILPIQSAVSINPLCCAPILGDFDGDCLHGYIPQSIRSRVELRELVSVEHQLFNMQDGRSLLALTHDSLTAAHLLTASEVFLNKFEMQQLGMLCPYQLPSPAIVKSSTLQYPLWTGYQLFSMLVPPSMDFSEGSRKLKIPWGEFFSTMFKCYGKKALDFLFSAQDVLCAYLTMRGLSVSLADVYLAYDTCSRTKLMDEVRLGLEEAEDACQFKQLMLDLERGTFLKNHDDSEASHDFARKRRPTSQISIAAFKNVFHDLQHAVLQYISRDNSMLAMIHAGSKGSLVKLVQQGACLGLHISPTPLPFEMPCKLSCPMDSGAMTQVAAQCTGGEEYCAVIKSSFLDGLNPLESFVHALSGRANLFSENAQLPGILTRKLMFYMRDLFVAYDGTVRSAYGQQLVQFDYDLPLDSFIEELEESMKGSGLGGQPVGSWAASSISEAAYGVADRPMSRIESSPLINLKNILECGRPGTSAPRTVSLFLSKKLERQYHGPEDGALEAKTHLERVFFSDVVRTVRIVYAGHEVDRTKLSPWISHFHLSKEMIMIKNLKIKHIVDGLVGNYNSLRLKINARLPNLCVMSKDCSLADMERKYEDTDCIRVSFERSESDIQLDMIKDIVIPVLLETVIKGFSEFTKVEILIDSQPDNKERLFLKVTSKDSYSSGKFWSVVLNACIPIMDLIDWEYSHPDDINDVFCSFGVDAAWRYFLDSLKTTTSDIGRKIHREHFLMVANSLSVTGEFHGLSLKGLKQQRTHASEPSPFCQAFFSNPSSQFIDAAKDGSKDHLCGTLDALSWGNEAPIGTGGPFELIYSGKVNEPKRGDDIYRALHSLKQDIPCQNHIEISKPDHDVCDKWKRQPPISNAVVSTSWSNHQSTPRDHIEAFDSKMPVKTSDQQSKRQKLFNHVHSRFENHASSGFESTSISCKTGSFSDVVDMHSSLRKLLHRYAMNQYLSEADKASVMEGLSYHPKRDEKLGCGIREIKVGHSPSHPGSRCFILIRNDGTTVDFSYRKCVLGAAQRISPRCGLMVEEKLFHRQSSM